MGPTCWPGQNDTTNTDLRASSNVKKPTNLYEKNNKKTDKKRNGEKNINYTVAL